MRECVIARCRVVAVAALAVVAGLLVGGCESGAYPLDIFPEMHYQQSNRPGEPPLVVKPAGSIPTTGREAVGDFGQTSALINPVEATLESIIDGRELYRVNCSMCHGVDADGDSQVARRFAEAGVRSPPNLQEGVAKVSPDGFIFAVTTHGLGNMPSLQRVLTPDERWTIINYLRSVQAAASVAQ